MEMTILDEVLIEEWNRKEYIVSVLQEQIDKLDPLADWERIEDYHQQIELARFDQRKIEAALQVAGIDIRDHVEERNRRKEQSRMFGLFGRTRVRKAQQDESDAFLGSMKSADIHEVLTSFPEFSATYVALKSAVRERYNWACDGLSYMTSGLELYDENDVLIAVPMNDDFVLVAIEKGDELGYKIVWADELLEEE